MPQNEISKQLAVKGMSCSGCEIRIEKTLKAINGISKVKASYNNCKVSVTYDESKVSLSQIKQAITNLDYEVDGSCSHTNPSEKATFSQLLKIALIMFGVAMLINRFGGFNLFNYFPEAKIGMSYAVIFIIGILTSVHCIGMCGGICLSQCVGAKGQKKLERMRPSFLYNLGRIISYTLVGGIVGAIGSVVSFNGVMRGAVALFAGIFMIIMGLNMLDMFPWLRKFSLRMPKFLIGDINGKSNSPLFIGLLNGLMPCGPLQAMQLYALSTGSPIQGAISMFLFALGTSFIMFGFGAISSILSKKFTSKLMTVSAVLVIVLGLGMFNTGLSMSGFLAIGTEKSQPVNFEAEIVDGYQIVEIEVSQRRYAPITVKKGIPVKFNLHAEAKNLNGCNNAIIIPEYGIQMPLQAGDNIVEFTPTETGTYPYGCWMNMIRSSITVTE
ncbi:MAG: sulfite exporter TauE/SafE family protein [Aminipila sp.]